MIQLTRTKKPNVLVVNAENWTKEYLKAKEIYEASRNPENKKALEKTEKKYNHRDVKDSLKIMFNNKCAFCESHITHVDYGQIEHFKPKSKYRELCFEWNNLLLSCAICNGTSNKGDKFPLENENGPLINPVDENPDDFFRFKYDSVTNKYSLFPKNENQRAITSIKILGLNRDDLTDFRTKELSKVVFYLEKIIDKNPSDEVLEAFSNVFSEKDQFFAFIKTLLENVKQRI